MDESYKQESYSDPSDSATPPRADPRQSVRHRFRSAVILVGVLFALGWLAINNPLSHSYLPRCPTEQLMGFYCPGCGSTRATHHLLNARLGVAMRYNPLMVIVGVPLALWYLLRTSVFVATGNQLKIPGIPSKIGWAALILVVVYTAVRNFPGDFPERLRPTPTDEDRANYQDD